MNSLFQLLALRRGGGEADGVVRTTPREGADRRCRTELLHHPTAYRGPPRLKAGILGPFALLAGCATTPRPAPAAQGWAAIVTRADVGRAHGWRTAFIRGVAQARAAGHGAEIDAEGALLQPDAALDSPALPDGRYKCRMTKLGAKTAGMLPYVAYPAFDCSVAGNRLTKLNGSQRQAGTLYPDSARRLIFLGTLALGDETMPRPYGVDPERDIVGAVERIGPNRWRLVMPYPRYESLVDVLELIPAA